MREHALRVVAVELQDTVAALRGVEQALHQHRDALRRAAHFATLGRLAAGLSHEIRNPLGALFLHIDLLEEEWREPKPCHDILSTSVNFYRPYAKRAPRPGVGSEGLLCRAPPTRPSI